MTGITIPERNEVLSRLFLFDGLDAAQLAPFFERLAELHLDDGEILLTPGQHNDEMYLILEGKLQVQLESPDSQPVAVLEAGESVGELSVIDRLETSAYVTAVGECWLAVMDQLTLWTMIGEVDGFARNLLYVVSRRVRTNNERIIASRQRQREWEHYATVDALTGLHNRRWLDETFGRLLERNRRAGHPLSLIMIDVDHFKQYNDSEGHVAGDCALRTVARVLTDQLRPTDHAVRYGGEEFSVLLPHTDRVGALLVAERLRAAIARIGIRSDDGQDLPKVTISLGATELQPDDTVQSMIRRADEALYQAKSEGRNRVASR